MEKQKGRMIHVSLRIPTNLKDDLQRDAVRRRINFNLLGNRILEKYLLFDRLAEHEHCVVIERKVFARILRTVRADDLRKIGREFGPKDIKGYFDFFGIAPTLDNLVSKYFEPKGAFSDEYDCSVIGDIPNLKIVLEHEYGEKWSAFLQEYTSGVIESILNVKPKVEVRENMVTIEFLN